jgi:GT2 family glycosyltransferase
MAPSSRQRVTIPIATYDRIDILVERTIPALLGQTYTDVEVIVVGDGTPPSLFNRLGSIRDPRLRTVHLEERTSYPSDLLERWMVAGWRPRNVGASLATGGWLLWMSDDDVIHPNGVETLLRCAQRHPDAEVVSAGFEVLTNPPRVELPSFAKTNLSFQIAGMPALLARIYTRAFAWNPHSHLRQVHRPSDYDLLSRMHRAGIRFATVDEIVASVPIVPGTGTVGSRAFAEEATRRGE